MAGKVSVKRAGEKRNEAAFKPWKWRLPSAELIARAKADGRKRAEVLNHLSTWLALTEMAVERFVEMAGEAMRAKEAYREAVRELNGHGAVA